MIHTQVCVDAQTDSTSEVVTNEYKLPGKRRFATKWTLIERAFISSDGPKITAQVIAFHSTETSSRFGFPRRRGTCCQQWKVQYRSKVTWQSRIASREMWFSSRETRLSSRETQFSSRETWSSSRETRLSSRETRFASREKQIFGYSSADYRTTNWLASQTNSPGQSQTLHFDLRTYFLILSVFGFSLFGSAGKRALSSEKSSNHHIIPGFYLTLNQNTLNFLSTRLS